MRRGGISGKFTSLCTSSPTTHPQGVAIIPVESLAKLTMPTSRWYPLHGCREDTHKVAQYNSDDVYTSTCCAHIVYS